MRKLFNSEQAENREIIKQKSTGTTPHGVMQNP